MAKEPITVMLAETIAASGNSDAYVIDLLRDFSPQVGKYTVQCTIAGSGTAKLELFLSNDGVTYTEHTADIATGLTAATTVYEVDPIELNYWRFKVTETGTSNSVIATLVFCAL